QPVELTHPLHDGVADVQRAGRVVLGVNDGLRYALHGLLRHRQLHLLEAGRSHGGDQHRFDHAGLLVDGALHFALDDLEQAVGLRTGEHRLDDVRDGDDLPGDHVAVVRRHLVPALLEHALPGEHPEEPLRLARQEHHLERQPVGDPADEEAEHRHHQRLVGQRPHDQLHDAEPEPEKDARACDERHLRPRDVPDQPVQQRFVAHQVGHDHVLEVEDVVDVVGELLHDRRDRLRCLRAHAVQQQLFRRGRQPLPQLRLIFRHHLAGDLVDRFQQWLLDFPGDLLGVQPGEDLARVDQVAGEGLGRDARHPFGVGGKHTLPAEQWRDADELQRAEHHLDGHPLGDVADQGRDERDRGVQRPAVGHVGDDGSPVDHRAPSPRARRAFPRRCDGNRAGGDRGLRVRVTRTRMAAHDQATPCGPKRDGQITPFGGMWPGWGSHYGGAMPNPEPSPNPAKKPVFGTAYRGYNKAEVDQQIERLTTEMATIARQRDEAVESVAELTKSLAYTQKELTEAKAALARLAEDPSGPAAMSERVKAMMQLAEEEIAEHKAKAEEDANATRAPAEAYADKTRKKAEETAAQLAEEAKAERERLDAEAADRRAEAERKSAEAIAKAEKESADKIAEAERKSAEEIAAKKAQAEK